METYWTDTGKLGLLEKVWHLIILFYIFVFNIFDMNL